MKVRENEKVRCQESMVCGQVFSKASSDKKDDRKESKA